MAHVVLVPAVAAGLVALSARALSASAPRLARCLAALAVPVAFLAGYFVIYRNFTFPPETVLSWVPVFVAALAVIASTPGRAGTPVRARVLPIAVAACAVVALLYPILERERLLAAIEAWAAATAVWSSLWVTASAPDDDRGALAAVLVVGASGLAVVAPLSGSILLGELAAALAVALVAAWVLAGFHGGAGLSDAARASAAFAAGAVLLDLRFYAGAGGGITLAFVASFALGFGAVLLRGRRAPHPWATLVPAMLASVPVMIAVAIAVRAAHLSGGY
ncbi:hypothetical protein [Acidiferrobacter sp.]|uniref:hypothetical protein n=1 Tax=Acidiferrobacter sp. TaxID=1872107 RepID=UPI0026111B8F|nr:hypothetical protein [Acidiferrobacter sp.]